MSALRRLLLRRESGILVMIVLFCLAVGAVKPQFLTLDQLRIVLLLVPLIMIGAMGQMLVLVARHVDLSIGSTLGFSAMVSGMLYRFVEGEPWWIGIPLSVAVGAGLGLLNGLVITLFRLPAIIVTLGTLSLYRGATSSSRTPSRSTVSTFRPSSRRCRRRRRSSASVDHHHRVRRGTADVLVRHAYARRPAGLCAGIEPRRCAPPRHQSQPGDTAGFHDFRALAALPASCMRAGGAL